MRIVAGSGRGRRLISPPSTTRPTSDRVREALFNSLDNLLEWQHTTVLDLYAGSGAVGLEAASHGARSVTLVEDNRHAITCINRNIDLVGASGITVAACRVQVFLSRPATDNGGPFSLVFVDPPYAQVEKEWPSIAEQLINDGWVEEGSVVVLERSTRDNPTQWPTGYCEYRSKAYGETRIDIALVDAPGMLAA